MLSIHKQIVKDCKHATNIWTKSLVCRSLCRIPARIECRRFQTTPPPSKKKKKKESIIKTLTSSLVLICHRVNTKRRLGLLRSIGFNYLAPTLWVVPVPPDAQAGLVGVALSSGITKKNGRQSWRKIYLNDCEEKNTQRKLFAGCHKCRWRLDCTSCLCDQSHLSQNNIRHLLGFQD